MRRKLGARRGGSLGARARVGAHSVAMREGRRPGRRGRERGVSERGRRRRRRVKLSLSRRIDSHPVARARWPGIRTYVRPRACV
jgi:hypothetical protein